MSSTMAETTTNAGGGGWGKVARVEAPEDDDKDKEEASGVAVEARARTFARDVGTAIEGRLAPAADRAARAMRNGANTAMRALDDPADAENIAGTDLPALSDEDPITTLALRLDREADLYRGLAMRQLTRAAWMDRLGAIGAVIALLGVVVLAAIAGFRALFASDGAPFAALLLAVGALLLLLGAAMLGRATARIRSSQAQAAREALVRSDLAEARLHRIAALLALKQIDPAHYQATIRDLERDMRQSG